jgi:transmembrane sensor
LENRFEHIDEVIARVLSGEATANDHVLVEEWIALSPANQQSYELSGRLFEQSAALKKIIPVDTDKAWLKVKSRMGVQKNPSKIISFGIARPLPIFLRIAAMLAIVAGLGAAGYYLLFRDKHAGEKIISSAEEVRHASLPDGSTVVLNRNSSLTYSSGKKRIAQLSGEAYFEVKHDEKSPFIVLAGEITIEDIGTSFNVKAYPGSKTIVISVAEGEVKVSTGEHECTGLVAGEAAEYDAEKHTLTKSLDDDKNITAYKDKNFIFENTELQVVVKLLRDIYGRNIVLGNEALNKCRLTASFKNESLDSILDVIAETLHLQMKKTETEILLNGDGCK